MSSAIERLASIGGRPLGSAFTSVDHARLVQFNSASLSDLLLHSNGFYAFESALHVLPCGRGEAMDLETWNDPATWWASYELGPRPGVFFAEDLFSVQFVLDSAGRVEKFNPETGERGLFAKTLEDWAGDILNDYERLTAHPIAHAWQIQNGGLRSDFRLSPVKPFVLGGDFELSNLADVPSVEAMLGYSRLAKVIRELPDGAQIEWPPSL